MWQDLLGSFGDLMKDVVLPPLAVAIAGLVVAGLTKLAKKWGIDLTEAQQEQLKTWVRDGIAAAEEWARRNLGAPSVAKRQHAIAYVQQYAPSLSVEEIGKLIDSQLPVVRAEITVPGASFPPTARGCAEITVPGASFPPTARG